MRKAELLVCGLEQAASLRLETWAQDQGYWFRSVDQPKTLLGLLRQGSRGVLVLRLGRDLHQELQFVQTASQGFPEVPIIVVGDVEHPELEGLVYDLGATVTLFANRQHDHLLECLNRSVRSEARKPG